MSTTTYNLVNQSAKKVAIYFGSVESPRTSLLGFSLIVVFFIQISTGILWFSISELSPSMTGLVTAFHRLIPTTIFVFILLHVSRTLVWHGGIGSRPLKSGLYVLFVLILTVSTGYIAAGGEAGFWGGVISFSPVVSILLGWFDSVWSCVFVSFGVVLDVTKQVSSVVVTGSTSINTAIYGVSLILHAVFGVWLLVHIYNHTNSVHGSASIFGVSSRESAKASLSAIVESRDLRVGLAVLFCIFVLQLQLMWWLRLGNAPHLSTEVKAPNKATTELYLSSIYDTLRQFPLVVAFCLLGSLVFIIIWLIHLKQSRLFLFIAACFIVLVLLDRSFAGFITQDLSFVEPLSICSDAVGSSVNVVSSHRQVLCKNWLVDPGVERRLTILGRHSINVELTGKIGNDYDPNLWLYLYKTMSLAAIDSRSLTCVVSDGADLPDVVSSEKSVLNLREKYTNLFEDSFYL